MAAKDHLNSVLFGFNVEIHPNSTQYGNPSINVSEPTGQYVANLEWNRDTGSVDNVDVDYDYQGTGIATEMWKMAKRAHQESPWHYPDIRHSTHRTEEGDHWAHSLYRKGLSEKPPANEYNEFIDELNDDDENSEPRR